MNTPARRRFHWLSASVARAWLLALVATNATSLVIDYADVLRWLLGERSA